jgi:hypothetical protein
LPGPGQLPPPVPDSRGGIVGSIGSRLKRLEGRGRGSCPECGLSPDGHRRIAVIYDEDPEKGFQGDPNEKCNRCGRPLYTVIRVVYEDAGDVEGGGG